jgi:hypothetical protein
VLQMLERDYKQQKATVMTDEMKKYILKTQATEIIRAAMDIYKLKFEDIDIDTLGEFVVTHFDSTFQDILEDFKLKTYNIGDDHYVKVEELMPSLQGLALLYLANETLMFHILKQNT